MKWAQVAVFVLFVLGCLRSLRQDLYGIPERAARGPDPDSVWITLAVCAALFWLYKSAGAFSLLF